jgi:bacterioferritin-associated ferredoxin
MDNNDIVCGCMNVSVQDIKDAIENGAKSFEEVQEATSVSTGCGSCTENVRELVDKLLGE